MLCQILTSAGMLQINLFGQERPLVQIMKKHAAQKSRADFIHKLGVVLKELKELRFWLKLIRRAKLIKDDIVNSLAQECEELCAIVAKSIITAKDNY